MKSIEELMSRFSKAELNEGVQRVKELMKTAEGEQIRQKLANMDKQELMKKLNELDSSSKSGRVGARGGRGNIIDKLNQFCDRK